MERKIIQIMSKYLWHESRSADDVYKYNNLVMSIDTFVESTDKPKNLSLKDVGWKAVISAISDLACKGVKPIGINFSVVFPLEYNDEHFIELAKGIYDACKKYNLIIGKGDTNRGKELIVTISTWGYATIDIPERGNINYGDQIVTLGEFGYTALALKILLNNRKSRVIRKKFSDEIINKAINIFKRPVIPINEIIQIVKHGYVRAAIDSSDGLAISLYDLMGDKKNIDILIHNIPIDLRLKKELMKNKESIIEYVFYGGEEYIPILAIKSNLWDKFRLEAKKLGVNYYHIGKVVKGNGLVKFNDVILEKRGWDPFTATSL